MNKEMAIEMPPLQEAIKQFREFLAKEGHSKRILWICRQDITWHGYKFFIKEPVPEENELIVEKLYDQGSRRGLGVSLSVFCLLRTQPCCYIWLPEDERDAELALVSGLKLSVPVQPIVAKPVKNWISWRMHRRFGQRAGAERWLKGLPQRGV